MNMFDHESSDRIAAAMAIGRIDLSGDPELTESALGELRAIIDAGPDDRLLGTALAAAVEIHRRTPGGVEQAMLALFAAAAPKADADAIFACTHLLIAIADELCEPMAGPLFAIFREVGVKHQGLITDIDRAVAALLSRGSPVASEECCTRAELEP